MRNGKDDTRRYFTVCLRKATELLGLISRQVGTNPTYGDLQDIMSLRSELDVLEDSLVEELDRFQAPDKTYRDVSALGRMTRCPCQRSFYGKSRTLTEFFEAPKPLAYNRQLLLWPWSEEIRPSVHRTQGVSLA
jgi:hypothetical protein